MKSAISRVLKKTRLSFLTAPSSRSIQADRCKPWFLDNGDKTLRLQYDLNENSIVFDVGGYEGQWASDIFSMYSCYIHIFEPVQKFASKIEKRFSRNPKITAHHYGLSSITEKIKITLDEDSSSIFKTNSISKEEVQIIKANDFIKDFDIKSIDLMKINIEGGEYDLLEHLLDCEFIHKISDIQVQFHDFVPGAEKRMLEIQNRLEETHFVTYQYPFVWENWRRKS